MTRAAPLLLAASLLAGAASAGCLEPYQVHVDPAVLSQVPGWTMTSGGLHGELGAKTLETRYAYDRDPDAAPPFAGSMQVFSIRSLGRLDPAELLDEARKLVATGAEENAIALAEGEQSGQRTLHSGVPTHWFVREGKTTQSGALFGQDVGVRILGEVGHDGRSDTSFLVIVLAQVSRANQCPLIGSCQGTSTDLRTWVQVVGDPHGSVQGATAQSGFVDHLVTR